MSVLVRILSILFAVLAFAKMPASEEWQRVYLATFARSGNHWMRALIEEATHVVTSSVYTDDEPPHSTKVFPWGGYCPQESFMTNLRYPNPGEIVVVKTHYPASYVQEFDNMPYTKIIRVVRHPIDTFYSFYVYFYKESSDGEHIPFSTLNLMIEDWFKFQKYWNEKENVITIRYEDLYNDPHYYLKLVLDYAGYQLSDDDISRAVAKCPPKGGVLKHLKHFQNSDLALIKQELSGYMHQFGYDIPETGSDVKFIQAWNPSYQ